MVCRPSSTCLRISSSLKLVSLTSGLLLCQAIGFNSGMSSSSTDAAADDEFVEFAEVDPPLVGSEGAVVVDEDDEEVVLVVEEAG